MICRVTWYLSGERHEQIVEATSSWAALDDVMDKHDVAGAIVTCLTDASGRLQ